MEILFEFLLSFLVNVLLEIGADVVFSSHSSSVSPLLSAWTRRAVTFSGPRTEASEGARRRMSTR